MNGTEAEAAAESSELGLPVKSATPLEAMRLMTL